MAVFILFDYIISTFLEIKIISLYVPNLNTYARNCIMCYVHVQHLHVDVLCTTLKHLHVDWMILEKTVFQVFSKLSQKGKRLT